MTIAEINGKLIPHETSEDLLTSDVFGTFSYLEPSLGLVPFLRNAVNNVGVIPDIPEKILEADYYFWPKTIKYRRESDLLLILRDNKNEFYSILVECKYYSGKSDSSNSDDDITRGDQLAEQYTDLLSNSLKVSEDILDKVKNSQKYLLFVTAHHEFPLLEIQKSIEILDKLGCAPQFKENIYWLSWRVLNDLITGILQNNIVTLENKRLLKDLRLLILRKQLLPFTGFNDLSLPLDVISNKYFWKDDEEFFNFKIASNINTLALEKNLFFEEG